MNFMFILAHVHIVILIENTEQLPDDLSPFKCHSHAMSSSPRPFKDDLPSLNEQLAHQPPSNSFHGPRQSMRDLQDSEELEKLFKPYAFKNKVLMVKKMGAILHKSFET